jgi:hypothetical protein
MTKSLSRSCCQLSWLIFPPPLLYIRMFISMFTRATYCTIFWASWSLSIPSHATFVTSIIIKFFPVTSSDLSVLTSQIILLTYFSPPIRGTSFRQPILLDLISPKYLIQRATHTWYFSGNNFYLGFSFSFYDQTFPSLARNTDEVQHRTSVILHYLLLWPPLIIGNRDIASPVKT